MEGVSEVVKDMVLLFEEILNGDSNGVFMNGNVYEYSVYDF